MNYDDDEETYNNFMIVWHMFGVEAVVDLDLIEQNYVAAKLREDPLTKSSGYIINFYLTRARVNTERNYEIWCIKLPTGITHEDVFKWFDHDTQAIVDLIRGRGICLLEKIGKDPVIR